ncbi:MAG: polysaccharide biosynthesis/export family protein [Candidatus Acidiferrales bacterium]
MCYMKSAIGALGIFALAFSLAAAESRGRTVLPKATSAAAPSASGKPTLDSPVLQRRGGRYRLYPSDEIEVTFPLTPEFNQTVTIEPDGYASLMGAGDVRLAGLTTEETVAGIKAAYTSILHDPIITVELKDFNKPSFVVTGEVKHPGKFDLRGPISATEAVAIAGGMTADAKASQVLLFRRADGSRYEVTRVNLKQILQGKDLEDTELLPGDMLYVPKSVISKVARFIPSSGFGAYYQLQP